MTLDQWHAQLLTLAEMLLAATDASNADRERAIEIIGRVLSAAAEWEQRWADVEIPEWYQPPLFSDGEDEEETPEAQAFRRSLREHIALVRAAYPHLTSVEGRA